MAAPDRSPAVRPDELPVLRLRDDADLLTAIPYLFGFAPAESLVVLGAAGPRTRLGVRLRFDLADVEPGAPAGWLLGLLEREGDDAALIVVYGERSADARPLPHSTIVEPLVAELEQGGIDVITAVYVGGGRYWSYVCANPECCPPHGRQVPRAEENSRVSSVAVATGHAVLPSRADLVATLAPATSVACAAVEHAADEIGVDVAARLLAGEGNEVRSATVALFRELVAQRRADPRARPTAEQAARVLLGCWQIAARDDLLAEFTAATDEAPRDVLADLVRRAGATDLVVPVAAMFAWMTYAAGNGILARVAVDRALAADPSYSLARLLEQALQAGADPALIRAASRGAAAGSKRSARGRRRRA